MRPTAPPVFWNCASARMFGSDEPPRCSARRPCLQRWGSMRLAHGSSYNCCVTCCVTIGSSARKHDVLDADIEHAMKHATWFEDQDDGRLLYIGASRSGALLEVVKVVGPELVIHAMPAKRTRLPGCRARR